MMHNQSRNGKPQATLVLPVLAALLFMSTIPVFANSSDQAKEPAFILAWEHAHPGYNGCLGGSVASQTVNEIPCGGNHGVLPGFSAASTTQLRTNAMYSYGPYTYDCNTNCNVGGEFSTYGPYGEVTGDIPVTAAPQNNPGKISVWTGVQDCNNTSCPISGYTHIILIQSGFSYGSCCSGLTPIGWVELYGDFYVNGVKCNTTNSNCYVTLTGVSAGDTLQTQDSIDGTQSYWFAFVEDLSQPGYPWKQVQVSVSAVGGYTSLPYVTTDLEAYGVQSSSYITTPIHLNTVSAFSPTLTGVDTYPAGTLQYYSGRGSSGISLTYTATYSCGGCYDSDVTIG